MKIGLSEEATQRAGDMIAAIDRLTAAIEANTAAAEKTAANFDVVMNGPRG